MPISLRQPPHPNPSPKGEGLEKANLPRWGRILAPILLIAATPAPSPLLTLQAQDARVLAIAHQLAARGVPYCSGRFARLAGMRVHIAGQYSGQSRRDAVAQFGLGDYPAILAIAPNSPAAKAGLEPGDWIIGVGDTELRDADGRAGYAMVERFEAALARDMEAGEAVLRFRRNRSNSIASIFGEPGCKSIVELVPSSKLNASADGRIVQITTGVLEQTRDDSELAFVIAHEMAHNILNHTARSGRKRDEEIQADELAIKLMIAGGYDPYAAARFWTRFGKKTGAGIFSDGTHLRTKARVELLQGLAIQYSRPFKQRTQ